METPDSKLQRWWPEETPSDRAALSQMAWLPWTNQVRKVAMALRRGETLTPNQFALLFAPLMKASGFRWREQEVAAWALGQAAREEPQKQAAEAILLRRGKLCQWPNQILTLLSRVLLVSAPIALLRLNGDASPNLANFPLYLLEIGALLTVPILPFSSMLDDFHINRVRAAAVRALGRMALPTSVGAVLEALFDGGTLRQTVGCHRVRRAAAEALHEALASLTPEHYGRLGASLVQGLCRALYHPDDALVLQVLEALERVGDGGAVAPVERMTRNGRTPLLREAAARVLPTLQERQRQENAPRILLRAAGMPTESQAVLLRPAGAVPVETAPEQLLRAGLTSNSTHQE